MDDSIVRNAHENQGGYVHEIWYFCAQKRVLIAGEKNILLTRTESQIVSLFLSSKNGPVSNSDITVGVKKCPDSYNGLRMTLSRLRKKFSTISNGESLFRSVRNRGYKLTQNLKPLPYASDTTVDLRLAARSQ